MREKCVQQRTPREARAVARVGGEKCTGLDPTTQSAESRVGWLSRQRSSPRG